MAGMIRKQVYIEPEQEEFLKRRSRELGVTEAELIRSAIDTLRREPVQDRADLRAWNEMKDYVERCRKFDVPQTGRGWARDELYDERLARYSD